MGPFKFRPDLELTEIRKEAETGHWYGYFYKSYTQGIRLPLTENDALTLIAEMGLKHLGPAVPPQMRHPAGDYYVINKGESTPSICRNCRHWRDKAWTQKGWGICDNPKNETYVIGLQRLAPHVSDAGELERLKTDIADAIRYPEDFGCIFFEPLNVAGS